MLMPLFSFFLAQALPGIASRYIYELTTCILSLTPLFWERGQWSYLLSLQRNQVELKRD